MPDPFVPVPERASSFVGRADVLADLAARFDGGARLVTVLAPGGMGKTRVAQRFAATVAPAWSAHGAGGVAFADLTPASSAAEVIGIVAETIGAALDREADAREVGRSLARRKRVLVVLDNCEHVVEALRALLPAWMAGAPSAQFLATSRVILGVDGEELLPLGPLPSRIEGVELFVQRARARSSGFRATDDDVERIGRIVDRLDGMPLAIELCAARALVLSLAEIEARLEAPLDLLVRADAGGKHDSMRRAIAGSVAQLAERERTLLSGLSIFRSSFTVRAAERVLAPIDPSDAPRGSSVLDAIELLVGRSLVTAVVGEGGARFTLYAVIREFAAEILARRPALEAMLLASHAAYFAADDAPPAEDDAADLTAAQAWALASPDVDVTTVADLSLRLAVALAHHPARARDAIDAALARVDEGAIDRDRLAALRAARGRASRALGRLDDAARDFERSVELVDAPAVALRLAEVVETRGDTARALAIASAAQVVAESMSPGAERDVLVAEALARVGHVHRREGRIADAQRETARAVALQRALGPSEGLAFALYEAAVLALFRGHRDASMAAFDEGLAVIDGLRGKRAGARLRLAKGALTTGRGTLLQELDRASDAIALHAEAARLFADVGDLHREGSALYYWAGAYIETGAFADAETMLGRALTIVERIGVPRYEALVAGALAVVVARRDVARARALLDAAEGPLERCAREGALAATLAIHRLHVDLLAGEGGDPLPEAEARAARFECDDPRFALRVLTRGRRGDRPLVAGLTIADDGAWFTAPGDDRRVDLTRRAPLRRILVALAEKRRDAPGDRMDLGEIVAAGWPGEKVLVEAAANRVYVALATLRKLGLRAVLSSGPGGYCLDPAVPLFARA